MGTMNDPKSDKARRKRHLRRIANGIDYSRNVRAKVTKERHDRTWRYFVTDGEKYVLRDDGYGTMQDAFKAALFNVEAAKRIMIAGHLFEFSYAEICDMNRY